jgi:hypothetical protein
MAFERSSGGGEPVRPSGGAQDLRRVTRSRPLASGTLACPACDAPVAPPGTLSPVDPLACPFCAHHGAVRDFLTLGAPTRPAHVTVHVRLR